MVKTSPQSLNVTSNKPFSLTCSVRAEHEGNPVNTIIQWIHIDPSSNKMKTALEAPLVSVPQYGSGLSSSTLDQFLTLAVLEYQVVESVTESSTFIYHCEATALNTTSFSDTTVFVIVDTGMLYLYCIYTIVRHCNCRCRHKCYH